MKRNGVRMGRRKRSVKPTQGLLTTPALLTGGGDRPGAAGQAVAERLVPPLREMASSALRSSSATNGF